MTREEHRTIWICTYCEDNHAEPLTADPENFCQFIGFYDTKPVHCPSEINDPAEVGPVWRIKE